MEIIEQATDDSVSEANVNRLYARLSKKVIKFFCLQSLAIFAFK